MVCHSIWGQRGIYRRATKREGSTTEAKTENKSGAELDHETGLKMQREIRQ